MSVNLIGKIRNRRNGSFFIIVKKRIINPIYVYDFCICNIYFTSKEIAEQAIQTIGKKRLKKYYFGVED